MNARLRPVGLTAHPFHDIAGSPTIRWMHRCAHRPGYWIILRARIRFPARDEWVSQADLPMSRPR